MQETRRRASVGHCTGRTIEMRAIILAAALALAPIEAGAAEFRPFGNDRYGFSVDVPAGYTASAAPENDDGRSFTSPDGRSTLAVYGHLFVGVAGMIEDERQEEQYSAGDGVRVTYRQVSAEASTFSGLKGERIVYQRAVTTCGGTAAAILHAEYPTTQKVFFDPLIRHMAQTLRGSNRCWAPGQRGGLRASGRFG